MPLQRRRKDFFDALHRTLVNLYDPLELQKSPLIPDLVRPDSANPGIALKKILHEAIISLMPDEETPPSAAAWRVYELLNYRFIDHLNQKETSRALSVSLRTVQRLEPEAIQILGSALARQYHIDLVEALPPAQAEDPRTAAGSSQAGGQAIRSQEYRFLEAYPSNRVNLNSVLIELVDFVQRLNRPEHPRVIIHCAEAPLMTQTKPALLRQALLTIISGLINRVATGEITLTARADPPSAVIEMTATGLAVDESQVPGQNLAEFISAMQQLVQISGGSLEPLGAGLRFRIRYPLLEQYRLLVVDDNADAIQLVQKYLEGTQYTANGVQQASQVTTAIEAEKPDLVIMDVMLPEMDGWLLLGQIRQLAEQARTPVIISSILPQEPLAEALGANGFLRKPFSPEELLAAIEQTLRKARE